MSDKRLDTMTEIADWHVRHRKEIDPDSLHKIIIKYYPYNENIFGDFFRTPEGHSLFKKVILLKSWESGINKNPPDGIYVQKQNGAIISFPTWVKEKEGMERRGERIPQANFIFPELETKGQITPSNLRENSPKQPWQMNKDEFSQYRDNYIKQQYLTWNKSDVNKFIKAVDSKFYTPDILEFRKGLKLVVREGDKANLYDFMSSRGDFVLIESKPFIEPQMPSNLREPTEDIDTSCQQLPYQYRDLLPFLDQYPAGSFLIEESTQSPAKIDLILQKLKDGVASIQDSALFREYLLTMSKFWSYSIANLILIMLQKRDATRVAGFNTWKELGRFVKTGEHGISILAPCLPPKGGYTYWVRGDDKYSTRFIGGQWYLYDMNAKRGAGGPYRSKVDAEAELINKGFERVKEEAEANYTPNYFKVVYVFDISQTSGKELPTIEVKSLTGADNPELREKMHALLKRKNVNVSLEPRPTQDPEIKGQFVRPNDIWVKPDESPAQQLKTLIHETGHYYTESVFMIPRADAETIAESVAFVVGAHYGFDSGTRSFPYVAIWSQDKKVLEKNLASIKNISTSILNDLGG